MTINIAKMKPETRSSKFECAAVLHYTLLRIAQRYRQKEHATNSVKVLTKKLLGTAFRRMKNHKSSLYAMEKSRAAPNV